MLGPGSRVAICSNASSIYHDGGSQNINVSTNTPDTFDFPSEAISARQYQI